MTPRTTPAQRLDALYAQIPDVECKGLCVESCTAFPVTSAERQRIWQATGKRIGLRANPYTPEARTEAAHTVCPLLADGRCTAHAIRPMLCRLSGVAATMPCEHGCQPTRVLPDADAFVLLAQAHELSGERAAGARLRRVAAYAAELAKGRQA